jgi:hypothetical protein
MHKIGVALLLTLQIGFATDEVIEESRKAGLGDGICKSSLLGRPGFL